MTPEQTNSVQVTAMLLAHRLMLRYLVGMLRELMTPAGGAAQLAKLELGLTEQLPHLCRGLPVEWREPAELAATAELRRILRADGPDLSA